MWLERCNPLSLSCWPGLDDDYGYVDLLYAHASRAESLRVHYLGVAQVCAYNNLCVTLAINRAPGPGGGRSLESPFPQAGGVCVWREREIERDK